MSFSIKLEEIKGEIANLAETSSKIEKIQGEINTVCCNLREKSDSYGKVSNALFRQNDALNALITKLASIDDGLERAVALYLQCEKNIIDSVDYVEVGTVGNTYFDITQKDISELEWYEWLWILSNPHNLHQWLIMDTVNDFSNDVFTSITNPEKAERIRNDKAMAKEIKAVLDEDKYSEAKWKTCSVEEREEVLEDLFEELRDIYGISLDCFVVGPYEEIPGNNMICGSYNPDYEMLKINEKLLSEDCYYTQIKKTMFHELRHAYQYEVVSEPEKFEVDDETINDWKKNMDDYKSPKDVEIEEYENQSIEKDADAFAERVIPWWQG